MLSTPRRIAIRMSPLLPSSIVKEAMQKARRKPRTERIVGIPNLPKDITLNIAINNGHRRTDHEADHNKKSCIYEESPTLSFPAISCELIRPKIPPIEIQR